MQKKTNAKYFFYASKYLRTNNSPPCTFKPRNKYKIRE